jgi:GT2 family glycosyltransferase
MTLDAHVGAAAPHDAEVASPYGGSISVSICICTCNRPEELGRALASIDASTVRPCQVIVSDDGADDRAARVACAAYPWVEYVVGPHQGLGRNRNWAMRGAVGSHVLFLDDDASLEPAFIETINAHFKDMDPALRGRAIMTGTEMRAGHRVFPHDVGRLGFQDRPYEPGRPMRTVVINATLFPRSMFARLGFDPRLVYGYDEVDLVTRAVAGGYVVVPCFGASVDHLPSEVNRAGYRRYTDASRLYVTFKRRFSTEHARALAWLGLVIGCAHICVSNVRHHGLAGIRDSGLAMGTAFRYIVDYVRLRPTER